MNQKNINESQKNSKKKLIFNDAIRTTAKATALAGVILLFTPAAPIGIGLIIAGSTTNLLAKVARGITIDQHKHDNKSHDALSRNYRNNLYDQCDTQIQNSESDTKTKHPLANPTLPKKVLRQIYLRLNETDRKDFLADLKLSMTPGDKSNNLESFITKNASKAPKESYFSKETIWDITSSKPRKGASRTELYSFSNKQFKDDIHKKLSSKSFILFMHYPLLENKFKKEMYYQKSTHNIR